MTARGKREREAERVAPGYKINEPPALKGRNISAFQALTSMCLFVTRGDALRACPWLFYLRAFGAKRENGVAA